MRPLVALALVAAAAGVVACGGEGDDGDKSGNGRINGPVTSQSRPQPAAETRAEGLCRRYREAVTDVRLSASDSDQAADFRSAAKAARAARSGTRPQDLSPPGRPYLQSLALVARAYEQAAAAKERGDEPAFNRALDVAEPTDERLDTFADVGGLKRCSLDEPKRPEKRVSQSGFPALIVPDGPLVPPQDNKVVYPLDSDEVIVAQRGPKTATGRVALDVAARRFEPAAKGPLNLREVGDVGDHQAPMRRYRYAVAGGSTRGLMHVFSGQGRLWLLYCSSKRPGGPSPRLLRACDRAVKSAGFLMF